MVLYPLFCPIHGEECLYIGPAREGPCRARALDICRGECRCLVFGCPEGDILTLTRFPLGEMVVVVEEPLRASGLWEP